MQCMWYMLFKIIFFIKLTSCGTESSWASVNALMLYNEIPVRVCWKNIPGLECESTLSIFLSAER